MSAIFSPTVNIFNNGIVINYKKVGSRFLKKMSSDGILYDSFTPLNTNQIDFAIFPDNEGNNFKLNTINYKFFKRHVFTEWHWNEIAADGYIQLENYRWKNDFQFLEEQGVSSYTEFFFENKKDIIFLIRNPYERFFSGLTQDIISYFASLKDDLDELSFFKKHNNFSTDRIMFLCELFMVNIVDHLVEEITEEELLEIFNFFLMYKWDLIRQDIHTEPYLIHFREMIYNMNDTSKLKVIDLSQMSTKASCNFLCNLRGDDFPLKIYESLTILEKAAESNKSMYSVILEKYQSNHLVQISFGKKFSVIDDYLKYETLIYNDLINSPYFINLED